VAFEVKLQTMKHELDFVKVSKEKMFEELANNLNELISSKYTLTTKINEIDEKYSELVREVTEKQEGIDKELEQMKDEWDEQIMNMQKENEGYFSELKRTQIINRNLVENYTNRG